MDKSNWKTARDLIQMVRKKMKQCVQKCFARGLGCFWHFPSNLRNVGEIYGACWWICWPTTQQKSKFPQIARKKHVVFQYVILSHGWCVRCVGLGRVMVQIERSWKFMGERTTGGDGWSGGVDGGAGWRKGQWDMIACEHTDLQANWHQQIQMVLCLTCMFRRHSSCSSGFAGSVWKFHCLLIGFEISICCCWWDCDHVAHLYNTICRLDHDWLYYHFFGHGDFPKKYWGIAVNTVVFHETTENEFVLSALLKKTCLWVKLEYLLVIPKCRLSPGNNIAAQTPKSSLPAEIECWKNTFLVWSVKPRKLTHNLLHQAFAGVFKQHLGYHKFCSACLNAFDIKHLWHSELKNQNMNESSSYSFIPGSSQSTYWTDQNYVWSPQFARWRLRTTRRCSLSGSLVLRSCHFSEMKRSIGAEWNCKVIFANAWLSEAAALVCTG